MLAIWGLITIVGMIIAIASRRVSPLIALLLFPVITSLAAGFGMKTGTFAVAGLESIAPVVAMFLFAILFFGILTDVGLVDPFVKWLLRRVGNNPLLIVPGTAMLALLLHLDGSGAWYGSPCTRLHRLHGRWSELPALDGTYTSGCQCTAH